MTTISEHEEAAYVWVWTGREQVEYRGGRGFFIRDGDLHVSTMYASSQKMDLGVIAVFVAGSWRQVELRWPSDEKASEKVGIAA